jgi:hypothetical protein
MRPVARGWNICATFNNTPYIKYQERLRTVV